MKVLFSMLLLIFGYNLASACSCVMPDDKSKADALRNSAVIFRGKVISIAESSGNQPKQVRFHILRAWKGVRKNEIIITTPSHSAACGYAFEKEKTYTVYAGGGSPPSTSSCLMMLVDEKLLRDRLGKGKSFENSPPPKPKTENDLLSQLRRKIASVFS